MKEWKVSKTYSAYEYVIILLVKHIHANEYERINMNIHTYYCEQSYEQADFCNLLNQVKIKLIKSIFLLFFFYDFLFYCPTFY